MSGLETAALVSLGSALVSGAVSAAQANQAASAQIDASNRAYAINAEQTRLAHDIEERRRKEALRAEQAARRARFGAAGIGSDAGSAAAVIEGLHERSARRGQEAARQRVLGLQANLLDVQSRNRIALLRAARARDKALVGIGSAAARAFVPAALGRSPSKEAGWPDRRA